MDGDLIKSGGPDEAKGDAEQKRALKLAGLLATGIALALLWVTGALTSAVPFPPSSLADAIIRITPGSVSTFFIERLQHWAQILLTLGVMAGTLALGSFALVFSARRSGPLDGEPRAGVAGAALAVVSALAIVAGPGNTEVPVAMVFVLTLAGLVYTASARAFFRLLTAGGVSDPARRRAVRLGVAGAVGVTIGGGFVGWFAKRFSGPDRDVALVSAAEPVVVPVRADTFPDIPGLSPEITSPEDHYVVDINLVQPAVDAESWELQVFGSVDQSGTYTFGSLQSEFEVVEEYAVLACISYELGDTLVGHSLWRGVRLGDVLSAAGVQDGAVDVILRGADGYEDSIPLDVAMDPSVLLAVAQNDQPLTQEHGFPCRVRIPKIYGMKNVKWLTSIEVVDSDFKGYWMERGWSDEAVVRTMSRIDVAGEDRRAVRGEQTWVAGIAWAGVRGIQRVEVSTDGGETWAEAMLKEAIGPYSWNLWAYSWTPDAQGKAAVLCRATDGDGEVQTSKEMDPHPSGATGWHELTVDVA